MRLPFLSLNPSPQLGRNDFAGGASKLYHRFQKWIGKTRPNAKLQKNVWYIIAKLSRIDYSSVMFACWYYLKSRHSMNQNTAQTKTSKNMQIQDHIAKTMSKHTQAKNQTPNTCTHSFLDQWHTIMSPVSKQSPHEVGQLLPRHCP